MATQGDLTASLTLRLQDGISAGLNRLRERLHGVRAAAERIGAIGAIGSGLAVGLAIQQAANFDDKLRMIAITAGKSGAEAEQYIARLRREFQRLALQTGQTSEAVADAAGLMIQRGLPSGLIDRLLPIAAKVATAAGAELKDVAGVTESLNSALGVLPDQLQRGMAMLIVASKEGKVELRDMAREFPALATAANVFGLKGLDGVRALGGALQVAAKASATPAEAANNLANLFQSLTRPETLKNFDKVFKVDFEKLMQDAEKKGLNPLEVAIKKVIDLTRGNPIQLGKLIGDMQAGRALMPFLQDFGKEYLRIKRIITATDESIIDIDAATRMAGSAHAIRTMTEAVSQLTERLGRELSARAGWLMGFLVGLVAHLEMLDDLAPDLAGNVIRFGAAMMVTVAVLAAATVVLPFVAAGFRVIWLLARVLLSPVTLLTRAFALLGMAMGIASAPILAIIGMVALLAAAAYTIAANWSEFADYFSAMLFQLRRALVGFILFLDGVFSLDMQKALDGLQVMFGGLGTFFLNIWYVVRRVFDLWSDGIGTWIDGRVTALVTSFKEAWEGLGKWFDDFWTNMLARVQPLIDKVAELLALMQRFWQGKPADGSFPGTMEGFHPTTFNPAGYGPSGPPRITGEITVRAAPGTTVEDVVYRGPVSVTPAGGHPDRGAMMGRA